MNTLMPQYTVRVFLTIGPAALLALAVKSVVVVVVAGAICLVLRRASAAARHLVWLLAVLGLLSLPLLAAVTPGWRLPSRVAAVSAPTSAPAFLQPPPTTAASPSPPTSEPLNAELWPPLWPAVLSALWLLGALLLFARLA